MSAGDVQGLLPCPFCGGNAELWRAFDDRPAWVACMGRCAVLVTRDHPTDADAIAAWNRRSALDGDALAKLIDAAVAAEREACAAMADGVSGWMGKPHQSNMDYGPNVARNIAAAIRSGDAK